MKTRYFKAVVLSVAMLTIFSACSKNDDDDNDNKGDGKPTVDEFVRPVTDKSSKWISKVYEYLPAPGQFINKGPGRPEDAQSIIGAKPSMVSLGGYGGYIIFGFDHTVLNGKGTDLVIKGNAFEGSSEPGGVMVSIDANGNGVADDMWYELVGEEHNAESTIHGYTITYTKPSQTESAADVPWTDNKGGSGALHTKDIISFHKQCYWPLFLTDSPSKLVFSGIKLRETAVYDAEATAPWNCKAVGNGYVDNYSADYTLLVNEDADTKNSNKFDIANAVDASGKAVVLKGIDFIKVYTCVNQEAGWLGELSTEVTGAISMSVKK